MKKADTIRLPTGIIDLDEKMEGGFVEGSIILLRGKAGTGKTAFCGSYLYQGAKNGEPGVYITTEQEIDDIKKDINKMFGWDLDALEQKGLIRFVSIQPVLANNMAKEDLDKIIRLFMNSLYNKIIESVREVKARRVVVDSISIIEMFVRNRYLSRVYLMDMTRRLKKLGVTSLLTEGVAEEGGLLGDEALTEFIADGVIKLDFVPVSERFKRTITISKMRRTNHSTMIHPFDFSDDGLRLVRFSPKK
jgi:circadian clock protein KaiC